MCTKQSAWARTHYLSYFKFGHYRIFYLFINLLKFVYDTPYRKDTNIIILFAKCPFTILSLNAWPYVPDNLFYTKKKIKKK